MVKSPIWLFFIFLLGAILATAIAPGEKTLGENVRVVYLHGAWVWASLISFIAAAVFGALGLLLKRDELNCWSRAIGRTGLFFWITYLPLSMWAMQTNWNGLFLSEPRWRLAIVFAVSGLLLQIGISLLEDPLWASGANMVFIFALILALQHTQNVMHPPAPIFNSNVPRIQLFFTSLLLLVLAATWQMSRWWYQFERRFIPPLQH